MSKPASSDVLGAMLIEALGLPPKVTSLQLTFKPGLPVEVRCTLLAAPQEPESSGAALTEGLRPYRLTVTPETIADVDAQINALHAERSALEARGPEAILPLANVGGRLGVRAA